VQLPQFKHQHMHKQHNSMHSRRLKLSQL